MNLTKSTVTTKMSLQRFALHVYGVQIIIKTTYREKSVFSRKSDFNMIKNVCKLVVIVTLHLREEKLYFETW
jgi:hypothetical protein